MTCSARRTLNKLLSAQFSPYLSNIHQIKQKNLRKSVLKTSDDMQLIHSDTRSLGFLLSLNWDRFLYFGMLALCLALSAYVASVSFANPFIL